MKHTTLEVQPDGRIFVIDGMPEEPKIRETNQFMYPDEKKRVNAENYAYEKALASANRILCADQEKAAAAIALQGDSEYIKQNSDGLEIGVKPGIYSLPNVEWEKAVKPVQVAFERWDYDQVAILKESPKEESQDLTVADVKAFIDHELGGYKVVHIGHAHKVINRQFIYESDVVSLALELLQNFTITRKP